MHPLLLYITILGFIVSFLLLINIKESNRVNIFLFAFFFINNLYSLAHYATIYSGSKTMIAVLLVNLTPLFLTVGPILYFYVRGVLRDDFRLSKLDLLHFIPAFILLINILPHLFSSFDSKLEYAERVLHNPAEILNNKNLFIPSVVNFLLRPIIGLIYMFVCIRLMFLKFKYERPDDKQSKLIFKWLSFLIFNALLVYASFLIFTIFSFQTLDYKIAEVKGYYFLNVTLIGLVLFNVSLLFFPNILYGLPQLDFMVSNYVQDTDTESVKKGVRSFEISTEKLELLHHKIEHYCERKPYLNPDFSLSTMSADTDIPVHHLSYYFNEHLNINFNAWKNDHKINYVIYLIENGSNEMLTLDALAKQAGFGSRTTFFNAFKQKMGLTPSEFLNKQHNL
ncbi:MAG: helix-turn-helix transcriptional regulator [Sediminibacterium sp.]|nr:helix-turn-helix transcriptional regulator [Sediminibacterium sp.]MBP6144472.1 helix-turn-helix transcriptional regulator [Sediminibacterium sp.]